MTTETKGGFYMTIFEHIFSVIGILIIIKHAVAHTRDRGNVRRIHRDLLYLLADICHIDPQNTAAAACIRSPYLL